MDKNIAIYGAQLLAGTIYEAIKILYGIKVSYFIVSDTSINPNVIDEIQVISLEDYITKNIYEQILIAVPEEHQQAIANELNRFGRDNYIILESNLRNEILDKYYRQQNDFLTITALCRDMSVAIYKDSAEAYSQDKKDDFLKIYMARSSKDKSLQNEYKLLRQIEPIQAGVELDDEIGILGDDTGDNISGKNRCYCELTALYWAWKNTNYEYTGLCHYRRMFCLDDQKIITLYKAKPDVILPYPTIHFPNINSQYVRYISDREWEIMREAVFIKSPEIKGYWDEIWGGQYFYNYNMMIASKKILNSYCNWLFDILYIVERLCVENKVETSKRYAGYMGEMLTTVYFLYHRKDMKIVHTGVNFLN